MNKEPVNNSKNEIVKKTIPLLIVVILFVVMVMGATYAFFTLNYRNDSTETTFNTNIAENGIVLFRDLNDDMYLEVDSNDMLQKESDVKYFASSEGTVKDTEFYEEEIGEMKVEGPGEYDCDYTLKIEASPESNNLYNAFKTMGENRTAGQIVLKINNSDTTYGREYDFVNDYTFPIRYSARATGITSSTPAKVKASLMLVNTHDINQSALAENGLLLSFTLDEFSCALHEEGSSEPSGDLPTSGTLARYVMDLADQSGTNVITQTTESTDQTGNNATTDYRYIGPSDSVNNYVKLEHTGGTYVNYRIIGVFKMPVITGNTASTTNYEWRVKLIKADSYGDRYWSGSESITNNNYNNSTLLNSSGELNTTYLNTLSTTTQGLIGPSIWYLGNSETDNSNFTVSKMYVSERSNTKYGDNPTNAINKIGLMYASDYGYATSGGTTKTRTNCLNYTMSNWYESSYADCYNNDWLFTSSTKWTITPYSDRSFAAFFVLSTGDIYYNNVAFFSKSVHPVFYLNSNVRVIDGNGSSDRPYILE